MRVLLIESDERDADRFIRALQARSERVEVTHVSTVEAAMAVLGEVARGRQEPVEVVVSDLDLPSVSVGGETEYVRALYTTCQQAHVSMVLLTRRGVDVVSRTALVLAGAERVVHKDTGDSYGVLLHAALVEVAAVTTRRREEGHGPVQVLVGRAVVEVASLREGQVEVLHRIGQLAESQCAPAPSVLSRLNTVPAKTWQRAVIVTLWVGMIAGRATGLYGGTVPTWSELLQMFSAR